MIKSEPERDDWRVAVGSRGRRHRRAIEGRNAGLHVLCKDLGVVYDIADMLPRHVTDGRFG